MNRSTAPEPPSPNATDARRRDRWARAMIFDRLEKLDWGRLILTDSNGSRVFGRPAEEAALTVRLTVHNPRFYSAVAFGGALAAAEAYFEGFFDADDLPGLVRLMVRNRSVLERMEGGLARLGRPMRRAWHRLRRNTRAGSRANIAAHYDLGNDFYRLFLDETMTYSCGVFERADATLAEASIAKYDRLCRKLRLGPGDRVVEIGCGWGGFALYAAATYGCHVTATTISAEQFDFARARIEESNLAGRIDLRREDYRDVEGRYDKLVSIEMIEAVGDEYLETFFRRCGQLLAPDGQMAIQAITIADQFHDRHVRTVDLIKRYIFPGSCLVSPTRLCQAATAAGDLRLTHLEDLTPHYATTLRLWRERFLARLDEVRAMGFDERFIRMWEYYLAYCQGAFAERYIGDVQAVFQRPACRAEPILGRLGAPEPVR